MQNTKRKQHLTFITLLILSLNVISVSHAQDYVADQDTFEQQRIREMRLLEWYAQQQQIEQGIPQSTAQNVSSNQPYNPPSAPAPVATPEADDLFAAANAGNVNQLRETSA